MTTPKKMATANLLRSLFLIRPEGKRKPGDPRSYMPAWRRHFLTCHRDAPYGNVRGIGGEGIPLEIDARVNTYRWLLDRVEYDEASTAEMRAWLADKKTAYPARDFYPMDWVQECRPIGEGDLWDGGPFGDNTFNHDCGLDTDLDFVTWSERTRKADYELKIALRVHLGVDVRSGYSRPAVFTADESDWTFPDVLIGSKLGPAWFRDPGTDDWLGSWSSGDSDEEPQPLKDFPVIGPQDVRSSWSIKRYAGQGHVVITPDRKVLCPLTGNPLTVIH